MRLERDDQKVGHPQATSEGISGRMIKDQAFREDVDDET
jgi:hypothetical protein